MKYAVDRIEEEIVILEDINSKDKKEVNINKLPNNIQEGNIVIFNEDNKYILDEQEENIIRKRIMDKFNKLKK